MKPLRVLTAAEQVATHLREEILRGTWVETMPGTAKLATTLNVGIRTVADALEQLESEGLLVNSGKRKKRLIVVPKNASPSALRVAILLYEPVFQENGLFSGLCGGLLLRLIEAGCQASFCNKTLTGLGMDLAKVRRYVKTVATDAWIVVAGSHEILEWFSQQPTPVFAFGGRYLGKDIAGVGVTKQTIIPRLVQRLVALGHRRIVIMSREERRKPQPAMLEQSFLDEMELQGIPTGPYNLPDWAGDTESLHQCLDSLFRVTPPTALFVEEVDIFFAIQQYLALRGIAAPRDISLICSDYDPIFNWCRPSISHISWDVGKLNQSAVNWVKKVGRGIKKKRKTNISATFVEGGTIGPVPTEKKLPPRLS